MLSEAVIGRRQRYLDFVCRASSKGFQRNLLGRARATHPLISYTEVLESNLVVSAERNISPHAVSIRRTRHGSKALSHGTSSNPQWSQVLTLNRRGSRWIYGRTPLSILSELPKRAALRDLQNSLLSRRPPDRDRFTQSVVGS